MKKNRTGRLLTGILAAAVIFTSVPQIAYATGSAVETGQEAMEEAVESGGETVATQNEQLGDVDEADGTDETVADMQDEKPDGGEGTEFGRSDGEQENGNGTVVDVLEQGSKNDGRSENNEHDNGEGEGKRLDGDNTEDVENSGTKDGSEADLDEGTEETLEDEEVPLETVTAHQLTSTRAATETIAQLKTRFPVGSYWNRVNLNYNNPDGVTYTRCPDDHNTAPNTCNNYKGYAQCWGFAYRLADGYYGSCPKDGWSAGSLDSLKAGDIIQYNTTGPDGHTIWVTGVTGDTISFADCNGDFHCGIRWDATTTKSDIRSKGIKNVWSAPYAITGTSQKEMSGPFTRTISDGDYHIVSALEGDRFRPGSKCLTIKALPDKKNSKETAVLWPGKGLKDHVFTVKWVDEAHGYNIKLKESVNHYLDVADGGLTREIDVQQNEKNNSSAQQWVIKESADGDGYTIQARCNELYVDVKDGNTANETNIRLLEGNGSRAQRWYFVPWGGGDSAVQEIPNGEYEIVPKADNSKALSATSGANVELGTRGSDGKHVFQVTYLGNGYYKMINKNWGLSLDVADAGSKRGTNVSLYKYDDEKDKYNQRWIIKPCSDGYFYIVSECNGLCVDLANGNNGTANLGTNISMWNYYEEGNQQDNQQWRFIPWGPWIGRTVSDGEYQIVTKADNNKVASATNNGVVKGANIELNSKGSGKGHSFRLSYCGDGYYSIDNSEGTLTMDVFNGLGALGTNVQLWNKLGDVGRQRWMLKPCGGGYYNIISKCNGLCVDLENGNNGTANIGANISMWYYHGGDNQKWKLESIVKPKLSSPTPSLASGSELSGGSKIYLNHGTADQIYYTLDGSDPVTSSTRRLYSGSAGITVPDASGTLKIKAYAVKAGYQDSDVAEFTYTYKYKMPKLDPPTVFAYAVEKGTWVSFNKGIADSVYWTYDDTDPVTSPTRMNTAKINTYFSDEIEIVEILRIRAYSVKAGYQDSDVTQFTIHVYESKATEKLSPPTASIPSGTEVEAGTQVSLFSSAEGADIYYSVNGIGPMVSGPFTTSPVYGKPIAIEQDTTVRAIALKAGYKNSEVAEFTYTVAKKAEPGKGKLSAPTASIPSGMEVEAGTQVSLSGSVDGASIYYTLDGTEPGEGSILYSQPIVIGQDTTVKAIAVKAGWQDSDIAEFTYMVAKKAEPEKEKLDVPTASIPSGREVEAGTQVSLSTGVDGASIYYTLDGTEPGEGGSPYSQPIVIERDTTIKAVAVKDGYTNSDIAVFVYQLKAAVKPDDPSPEDPGVENPGTEDPGQGDVPGGDIPGGDEVNIPDGLWVAGLAEDGYPYTGKAIKPAVRVYDHKTLLTEKKDYTISYSRNTKAYGYASTDQSFDAKIAPTITVKAKGNYSGKETLTFKILPPDIGGDDFAADDMTVAYKANGVQRPVPVLIWKDKKLKNKTDYTVNYYDSNGNKIDSVKTAGKYDVELAGKGNFGGTRRIELTVTDSLKLVDKVSVTGTKSRPYTGGAITPALTVKDGGTTLKEGVHYTASYSQNTEVGTAYAVIKGIETAGYGGTKRVSFKITGTPINKAAVTGVAEQQFFYEGTDITPQFGLDITAGGTGKHLSPETDYTVIWQKNRDAGTASVIFTGKGTYTGTMKKTFKIGKFDIAANAGGRFTAELEQDTVPYAKGGAKPKVVVKFKKGDGNWQTLVEGQDYTLSCGNHMAVNDGSRAGQQPTVTVKGKGNFSGTFGAALGYKIVAQDIGQLTLTAQDKTYQNKKNIYTTKVTVTDLDGKALKAGTDYNKNFAYTYKNETVVMNVAESGMTVRAAGDFVGKNDIIPAGTVLVVRADARGGGNYTGTITGEYRITQAAISATSVSIPRQTYTGREITLDKSRITVKMKGGLIDPSQYEIVPDSYKNNVKKGTASVTIRGVGSYGGTKTVKFSIGTKGFSWWWR